MRLSAVKSCDTVKIELRVTGSIPEDGTILTEHAALGQFSFQGRSQTYDLELQHQRRKKLQHS
jgi:hypothetical protein